ncbi:MAG: lantibiotic dehydratase [Pseudonocardiaceae bacterium]
MSISQTYPQTYLRCAGRSPLGRWEVAPSPVVRVAGLPVSVLAALRFATTTTAVATLDHEHRWLRSEGAALSDVLHGIIGAQARPELRPVLVGLRRALHQARVPSRAELGSAAGLPADVGARIAGWCDRLAAWQRDCRGLQAVLAAEKELVAARVRQLGADPGFRRALSQAGPTLLDELDKWRRDDRRSPRPQKLVKLVRYLTRAAAKTSPYSAFMRSGFGEWGFGEWGFGEGGFGEGDGGTAPAPVGGSESRPVLELGGQFVTAIRSALARLPELAPTLPVRVNPSSTSVEGGIRFLGPAPVEPVVGLDRTPALSECLRLAGRTGQTVRGLRDELGAAVPGADPAAAARFVDRLVQAGLLEPFIPVPDLSADPLGDLAAWLAARDVPDLAALLTGLRDELRRHIPMADVDEHRARQRALHQALTALADRLDLDRSQIGRPEQLFHEVVVSARTVERLPGEQWQPALDDLDVVRRWLTVFDWKVPIRLALAQFVEERFGAGARVPFLVLYRAVQEEFARPVRTPAGRALHTLLGPGALPWFADLGGSELARLRRLHGLRAESRRLVAGQVWADGVVRLDTGRIAEFVTQWPSWLQPPRSTGCYVQTWTDAESAALRLVLGAVHSGHGRGASRLRHLMGHHAAPPVPGQGAQPGHGQVVAEFGGLMGTALNLRAPAAPYEIDYPGTVSGRPAGQRIPLSDLVVVHDPGPGLVSLHSDVAGTRVTPVHLGMMADFHLPPAARFLDRAFNPSYLVHPSSPPLMPAQPTDPHRGLVHHPRVEAGRVVVRRARWLVPAALLPARRAGHTDADHLRLLIAWRREHGIPETCFVRVWGPDSRVSVAKARKPFFVDFANWFLVESLTRQISGEDTVLFEEALPDPAASAGTHVTEFLIEMSVGEQQ